ncbi:hypothetical protein BKG69_03420 [Mycobacteroides chelonae]|uniref:toll/interleukin-1 receptor domain-containing protein n=1 Tax=Mycobacteroides chelonae TaxID=1774 RepID=UPI0008AA5CDC|nr:toll/interleukin-1 receptor domain-containing protein [Mycobacteroides chelonae]OHT81080.1 hypothetical protein BKG69_03420 [Mycobacteroides chelonae]
MSSKRFFISHASPEKPFAIELKAALEGDAWVDLHEIKSGDILLREISDGIEAATDFVLLWSAHSAASNWVAFEINLAFIRYIEEQSIQIHVVCMDATAPVLTLRPFLQIRGSQTAQEVATKMLSPSVPAEPRRHFLNRNLEVEKIESALYDPATAALFVCGVPGSGKRSLARTALGRVTSGSNTVQSIPVSPGVSEPELNLLVAGRLQIPPSPETASIPEIVEHTTQMLRTFAEAGGVWIFEEGQYWLNDDGTLGRICIQIIEAITESGPAESRLVVFTSRRKPRLTHTQASVSAFYLDGLNGVYSVALLRAHGAAGTPEELDAVARQVAGHPLALEVVARQLPLDTTRLEEQRYTIASDLIDASVISPSTWSLLEILALGDGPMLGEDLAAFLHVDADGYQAAVSQAVEHSLITFTDIGLLTLHPLYRDYFYRSLRQNPNYRQLTDEVADTLHKRLAGLPPADPLYTSALLSTVKVLGLAGRFNDARNLRKGLIGTLQATAQELYQQKRYEEALKYIDEALTGDMGIDMDLLRLRIKTLAYLGDLGNARSGGDELIAYFPKSAAVVRDRGRIEFIARDYPKAVYYFQKAIPLRHKPAPIWVDIAQAQVRQQDWEAAAAAAKTAIDSGADTPYALALYSQALEEQGDYLEAERMMTRAVQREPKNSEFRHRLGRIAIQTKNLPKAIEQFEQSLVHDPNYVQSWLSLASARADDGDLLGAKMALDTGAKIHGAPQAIIGNVRAKIHLKAGELEDANTAIEAALNHRRDKLNLALAVRIIIALAEQELMSRGQAKARVKTLSIELEAQDSLRLILEYATEFPSYFEF